MRESRSRPTLRAMRRRRLVVLSLAGAAVVAGALVAVLAVTTGGGSTAPAAGAVGASRVATMLAGIPQRGEELGSSKAPVTLIEFADPQCPYCGDFARAVLPEIIQRYVRTGKVQIRFNGMAFVGADSVTALRTALAAGRQDRFWNVMELLFENQGTENTGWVTDSLLRSIGSAVPGLDTQKMLDERNSNAVDEAIARAATFAQQAGVNSTPTFAVGKTGGSLQIVQLSSLDASALTPSIDAALAG
jgi:protein-disulfide isomerase